MDNLQTTGCLRQKRQMWKNRKKIHQPVQDLATRRIKRHRSQTGTQGRRQQQEGQKITTSSRLQLLFQKNKNKKNKKTTARQTVKKPQNGQKKTRNQNSRSQQRSQSGSQTANKKSRRSKQSKRRSQSGTQTANQNRNVARGRPRSRSQTAERDKSAGKSKKDKLRALWARINTKKGQEKRQLIAQAKKEELEIETTTTESPDLETTEPEDDETTIDIEDIDEDDLETTIDKDDDDIDPADIDDDDTTEPEDEEEEETTSAEDDEEDITTTPGIKEEELTTTAPSMRVDDFFPTPPKGQVCTSARPPEKCLAVPRSVCVSGKVITLPATQPGLIARWSFDDNMAADSSGQGHHLLIRPQVGPGKFSRGQSARFSGADFTAIGHSPAWDVHDFAVSFWVFLLEDEHGGWRTIMRKGFPDEGDAISLSLWPTDSLGFTRRLHLRVTSQSNTVASIDSVGALPLQRWTHIAFNVEGKDMQLIVNGIPDTEGHSPSKFGPFTGPLYIGGDPWLRGIKGFIDEFQYYGTVLPLPRIQALSAGALGSMQSEFARFGCISCPLDEAVQACSAHVGYHVCTEDELVSGAWRIARAQGWLFRRTRLWSYEATTASGAGEEATQSRLAVCCSNTNI